MTDEQFRKAIDVFERFASTFRLEGHEGGYIPTAEIHLNSYGQREQSIREVTSKTAIEALVRRVHCVAKELEAIGV